MSVTSKEKTKVLQECGEISSKTELIRLLSRSWETLSGWLNGTSQCTLSDIEYEGLKIWLVEAKKKHAEKEHKKAVEGARPKREYNEHQQATAKPYVTEYVREAIKRAGSAGKLSVLMGTAGGIVRAWESGASCNMSNANYFWLTHYLNKNETYLQPQQKAAAAVDATNDGDAFALMVDWADKFERTFLTEFRSAQKDLEELRATVSNWKATFFTKTAPIDSGTGCPEL